jgi:hypothetical protein
MKALRPPSYNANIAKNQNQFIVSLVSEHQKLAGFFNIYVTCLTQPTVNTWTCISLQGRLGPMVRARSLRNSNFEQGPSGRSRYQRHAVRKNLASHIGIVNVQYA